MNCPKCNKAMRLISTNISSAFEGSDATPGLIHGYECSPAGCGTWKDVEITPMPTPSFKSIKAPIEQSEARKVVTENMPTIKHLRYKGLSFRAIIEQLKFDMNHTTLQKHYRQLIAGISEMGKRGRKKTVRV